MTKDDQPQEAAKARAMVNVGFFPPYDPNPRTVADEDYVHETAQYVLSAITRTQFTMDGESCASMAYGRAFAMYRERAKWKAHFAEARKNASRRVPAQRILATAPELSQFIERLDLAAPAKSMLERALCNAGITTTAALAAASVKELMGIPNIGVMTVCRLQEALRIYGE